MALAVAFVAAAALVITYLALGGGEYKPREVADPCKPRPWRHASNLEGTAEQIALSALDGAACRLRVTREELLLALASTDARKRFARTYHLDDRDIEHALRAGLRRAIADARRAGAIGEVEARLLREAVDRLPLSVLIRAVRGGRKLLEDLGALGMAVP